MENTIYWKIDDHKMVLKIQGLLIYYVQVVKYKSGRIKHHYGKSVYPDQERLEQFLKPYREKMAPASQEEFIEMARCYVAMAKNEIRNEFIENGDYPPEVVFYEKK